MSVNVQLCATCGTVNFPAKYVCAKCRGITFSAGKIDAAAVTCFTRVEKRMADFPYAYLVELQIEGAHFLAVSAFEPNVGERLEFDEPAPGLLRVRREESSAAR